MCGVAKQAYLVEASIYFHPLVSLEKVQNESYRRIHPLLGATQSHLRWSSEVFLRLEGAPAGAQGNTGKTRGMKILFKKSLEWISCEAA